MDPITLNELFFTAVDTHRQQHLFKFKKDGAWHGRAAADVDMRVRELSLGLAALGARPGDRVAILSENRPEWVESDLAILTARAVTVPVYATLPAEQIEHILANSEARVLLASNAELAARVRRAKVPKLQHVVLFDGVSSPSAKTLAELLTAGRDVAAHEPYRHRAEAQKARPEDLATLIYTSGTTGTPKGVMLSHGNIASNVASAVRAIPIDREDLALSFLPLSHIFERMMTFALIRQGAAIAFAEAMEKVPENLVEVKPTIVAGVPRFYEKIHERVMTAVRAAKPSRQRLFESALEVGRERSRAIMHGQPVSRTLLWKYRIASMTVFRRIRDAVGGRVRIFVCGGAPLPREIGEFFHAAGFTILEGYGLTETSPVITVNRLDDFKFGTVGKPVAGVDVKIAEDGEILARGPNVMAGYWNLPRDTKEALHDGWFHTGDIGHFDHQGFLVITDRKKELLKTSGGKFVAPAPLENALKASRWIANAVVLGDRRRFCSALLVPRFDDVERFARDHGLAWSSRRELVSFPAVRKLFEAEVEKANAGKAQHETLKKFAVLDRDFLMAEGELTPTLKVKRRVVEEHFRDMIEGMYREEPPADHPPVVAPAG